MTSKNAKTILLAALAAMVIIPVSAAAVGESGKYTLGQITHAFEVMEKYTAPDGQLHLQIDDAAENDPNVSNLDMEIVRAFAVHNDEIMDAASERTSDHNNKEQLRQAIERLENGRFSAMFSNIEEEIIIPMSFGVRQAPAFETLSEVIETRHSPTRSLLACGGNYANPHTNYDVINSGSYPSHTAATAALIAQGYHQIYAIYTYHYPNDYGRVDTTPVIDPHCNNGEFREQGIVYTRNGNTWIAHERDEPNPELHSYIWPKLWWGSYVEWWHLTFT